MMQFSSVGFIKNTFPTSRTLVPRTANLTHPTTCRQRRLNMVPYYFQSIWLIILVSDLFSVSENNEENQRMYHFIRFILIGGHLIHELIQLQAKMLNFARAWKLEYVKSLIEFVFEDMMEW